MTLTKKKKLILNAGIRPFFSGDDDERVGGLGPKTGLPKSDLAVKERVSTQKPSMYKVYLLNDDYTPMEFVIHVLETYFNKTREDATRIMLHVHRRGMGLCGVFTKDVAETKIHQVMDAARQAQHPLQCTMEKE